VSKDEAHIIDDFHILKEAISKIHKENPDLNYETEDLEEYFPEGSKVNLEKYQMSDDKKFIIVSNLISDDEGNDLVAEIGGKSFMKDGIVYLCVHCHKKESTSSAVAKITFSPKENITTTTPVQFDSSASKAEGGVITEEEWKGKEPIYREAGTYTVELRVKDDKEEWSDWETVDIKVVEEEGIKSIEAGGDSVFAVFNNGEVEAYGGNSHGQLGNSTTMANSDFQLLVGHGGCFQLATGDKHTLFIDLFRGGKAVGKNSLGQLGIGNRTDAKTFEDIWGVEKIKEVACGNGFSAALTYDGEVYTWGNNEFLQLGHSEEQKFVEMPTKVEGILPVKQISLGSTHVLCLLHDGTMIGWGENTYGQLGLGYKGKSSEPEAGIIKDIKFVCAGEGFSFAVLKSGRVHGFGLNKRNQLGIMGTKEILFPEEILQLKGIVRMVSGRKFTLALDENGQVFAWGQFDEVENDYPISPTLVPNDKYAKDIAATESKGYILTITDEVLEFGTEVERVDVVRGN